MDSEQGLGLVDHRPTASATVTDSHYSVVSRPSGSASATTSQRFANLGESEITKLLDAKDSKSTKKCLKLAKSLFLEFITDTESSLNLEDWTDKDAIATDLDKQLGLFFANVRSKDGSQFKKASLQYIRYGVARYVQDQTGFDINKDERFASSRKIYSAVIADAKRQGLGGTDHKPAIAPEDMLKLYDGTHHAFDIRSPAGLQNKVWFELTYYVCRRGRENMRQMNKETFSVQVDASGRKYVFQKVDESDKNHKENASPDDTTGEGRMYQVKDSPACPVASYELYISKLHPALPDLWQRPLEACDLGNAPVWYYKTPVGKNTLANMMSKISKQAGLSKIYTNHSVRATCITLLDEAGLEARHIMRVSGHRSESSIRSYTARLNEDTQRKVSDTLSAAAGISSRAVVPQAVTPGTVVPQAVTPGTVVPQAVTPGTVLPQAVTPGTVVPQAVTPGTVVPQAITPGTVVPQAVTPGTVVPQAVTPGTVVPQAVTPGTVVPQAVTPGTVVPTPEEPTFELVDWPRFAADLQAVPATPTEPNSMSTSMDPRMHFMPQFTNCAHVSLNINFCNQQK